MPMPRTAADVGGTVRLSGSTVAPTAATVAPVLQESNIRGITGGLKMFLHLTNSLADKNMVFHFPFPSNQIQFTDLSSTYVEINRPKFIPIVEFSSHKLMKFQMEFLLSHVGNGVSIPVDEHITFLRTMATSKQGIMFADGNKLLLSPLKYTGITEATSAMYYITDMSVNAQRMTYDNKGIAVATVSMSFTEVRNPVLEIVKIPKIKYTKTKKPAAKNKTNPKGRTGQTTLSGSGIGGSNKGKTGISGGTGTTTNLQPPTP